jgi:hypothetical protein
VTLTASQRPPGRTGGARHETLDKLFSSVDGLLNLDHSTFPPPLNHPPSRWDDYSKLTELEKLTVLQVGASCRVERREWREVPLPTRRPAPETSSQS